MTRTPSAKRSSSPEPLGAPFSASAHLPSTTSRRRSAWRRPGSRRAASPRHASTVGFTRSIRSTVIRGVTRPLSEGLDEDGLAGRDVAALLLEHDETVAGDHRGEDARSLRSRGTHLPAAVAELKDAPLELAPPLLLAHRLGRARRVDLGEEAPPTRELEDGGNRKSTRLNSSHSQISYAVFCLKKKIITDNDATNVMNP